MILSVLKATEGGIGQKTSIFLLKEAGIKARPATSIYVGHTGVEILTASGQVSENKRVIRKAEKVLWG